MAHWNRPPVWAQQLITRVVDHANLKDSPTVLWRTTDTSYCSSGVCYLNIGTIKIIAGREKDDQKLVLLHELSHWLVNDTHTEEFWLKAWELYRQHHVNIDYALNRECYYMKKAYTVAKKVAIDIPRDTEESIVKYWQVKSDLRKSKLELNK